jgi:hypothetical protein
MLVIRFFVSSLMPGTGISLHFICWCACAFLAPGLLPLSFMGISAMYQTSKHAFFKNAHRRITGF